MTASFDRQKWLEDATAALRQRFRTKGYTVPAAVRVSVGWPKGTHGSQHTIGQCWSLAASTDKHNEIFVSPEITLPGNSIKVLGVLAHELVHATVGNEAGHKKPFKQCAIAIGLEGKMTATTCGMEFVGWGNKLIAKIGKLPAGAISQGLRKKQTTRLLKCECDSCGYIARVTRQWVEDAGAPICPTDQEPLRCDSVDEDED